MNKKLSILVVDDSALYLKVIQEVLSELPDVEVVGAISEGRIALEQIEILKPDVVTIDVEMPQMDGLMLIKELQRSSRRPAVVMMSAFSSQSADATIAALQLGAVDYVLKPLNGSLELGVSQLRARLRASIEAYVNHELRMKENVRLAGESAGDRALSAKEFGVEAGMGDADRREAEIDGQPIAPEPDSPLPGHRIRMDKVECIGIGLETGGPAALFELLPQLPSDLNTPIIIAQKMPPMFTQALANALQQITQMEVCEARDEQPLLRGKVYVTPGGRRTRVVHSPRGPVLELEKELSDADDLPLVDALFKSMSQVHGKGALGIVMTGGGQDGTKGARTLKRNGASVMVQDPNDCFVGAMPAAIIDRGFADEIIRLDQLAVRIREIAHRLEPSWR